MPNTVLVTGAAGFIGSHLCEALLSQGHHVIGLDCFTDYYPRSRKEANLSQALVHPNFQLLETYLLTPDTLTSPSRFATGPRASLPLLQQVDLVYHLAGQPGVRGSWGQLFEAYARNNILATQRLLEAATSTGETPVVYAASSSAYGNLPTMPLQEDMKPTPVSPYGVTKLAAEHLCRLYSEVYGLPTIALRLFTVYGPRQRPDMAFQRFLTALHRDQELVVYGDGKQTRDFTYVDDVIRGLLLAGESCLAGRYPGEMFNIAGGSRVSLAQVLSAMESVTGRQPRVRYQPAQPGDVRDTWADTTKIHAALGFAPKIALAEGLARHWRSIQ